MSPLKTESIPGRFFNYGWILIVSIASWALSVWITLSVVNTRPQAPWAGSIVNLITFLAFKGIWWVPFIGMMAWIALLFRCRKTGFSVGGGLLLLSLLTALAWTLSARS